MSSRRLATTAAWPYVSVALVGVAHRLVLYWSYRSALTALAEENADWTTMQLLPLEMLRTNATASLVYLQQAPPIPVALTALVAKWRIAPGEVAGALIGLQSLVSCATAVILTHVVLTLFPGRRLAAAAIGILFVLDTNLVILEYNALGQTFYENLSMLLALASVALLISYWGTGRRGTVVALGVIVALLALTRASWSYFAIPVAAIVAMVARDGRTRAVGLFLVPVVVLHGGWCVKNWIVYGYLSPATSTWAGWNLVKGISTAGFGPEFDEFVRAHPGMSGERGPCSMAAFIVLPRTEVDEEIADRLGSPQPNWNTVAVRLAAADCQKAVAAFCAEQPAVCMRKMWLAYQMFWLPMGYYGYLDLFAITKVLKNSFDPIGVAQLMANGRLPDAQYVVSGKAPHTHGVPANVYTPRWVDPLTRLVNVIGVHLVAPLVLIAGLWRPARTPTAAQRRVALRIAFAVYAYLALVSSVAEYGENMRFRLGIEPVIWLITTIGFGDLRSVLSVVTVIARPSLRR